MTEYDFRVVFTRVKGDDAVGQHVSANGRNFHWFMGSEHSSVMGFAAVNGKPSTENATTVRKPGTLVNGRRYESVVQVRRDGVAAYVDGMMVAKHRTDYSDMSKSRNWPDSGGRLGIGCFSGRVIFHAIEVTEVAGQGRLLRPER